jgi:hypothetical protein
MAVEKARPSQKVLTFPLPLSFFMSALPSHTDLSSLFLQLQQSPTSPSTITSINSANAAILDLCGKYPIYTALLCSRIILSDDSSPFAFQQASIHLRVLLTPQVLRPLKTMQELWRNTTAEDRSCILTAVYRGLSSEHSAARDACARALSLIVQLDSIAVSVRLWDDYIATLLALLHQSAGVWWADGALQALAAIFDLLNAQSRLRPDLTDASSGWRGSIAFQLVDKNCLRFLADRFIPFLIQLFESDAPLLLKIDGIATFRVLAGVLMSVFSADETVAIVNKVLDWLSDADDNLLSETYELLSVLCGRVYDDIPRYIERIFDFIVRELQGATHRQELSLHFIVELCRIENSQKHGNRGIARVFAQSFDENLFRLMTMFGTGIPSAAKQCLKSFVACGHFDIVFQHCQAFSATHFADPDWRFRFAAIYCNRGCQVHKSVQPDYITTLWDQLGILVRDSVLEVGIAAAKYLVHVVRRNSPIRTEVIPTALSFLEGPPEIAVCGWRMIDRFASGHLSQSMSPDFESIANAFFAQLDSRVIVADGYLFRISNAIVSVICSCSEESFDQVVAFGGGCADRMGAVIDGRFARWAEETFGDSQIAPLVLSCLLVIVAGVIQQCSLHPGAPDLANRARAIAYHVLDQQGNLDVVEGEAIHLLSVIVTTMPDAMSDGSTKVIDHLLSKLSSPSDEIAGVCARLIGDLYAKYSIHMAPYAEAFMTVLFQRLANPIMRFLPAAKLCAAVGDIFGNLEPYEAFMYRDATTEVLRAFGRMEIGSDTELAAEVIYSLLHLSRALVSVLGKLKDQESIKYFRACRHVLFEGVKKLSCFSQEGKVVKGSWNMLDEFMNFMSAVLNPDVQAVFAVQIAWSEIGELIQMVITDANQRADYMREARAKVLDRRRRTLVHL